MSLFKNLFQKDEAPQPSPAESPELTIAWQMGAMLQCPVTELAREQFAFCEDIVYQGVGSIPALAKGLEQSTVWYFWWD